MQKTCDATSPGASTHCWLEGVSGLTGLDLYQNGGNSYGASYQSIFPALYIFVCWNCHRPDWARRRLGQARTRAVTAAVTARPFWQFPSSGSDAAPRTPRYVAACNLQPLHAACFARTCRSRSISLGKRGRSIPALEKALRLPLRGSIHPPQPNSIRNGTFAAPPRVERCPAGGAAKKDGGLHVRMDPHMFSRQLGLADLANMRRTGLPGWIVILVCI